MFYLIFVKILRACAAIIEENSVQRKCNFGVRRLLGALVLLGFPFVLAVSIASAGDGPSIGYSLTPFYPANNDGARLSKVKINGSNIVPAVEAGSRFRVEVTFNIVNIETCPDCLAQITVGFSHGDPKLCIYNDIPGTTLQTGTESFTLRAPGVPGRFYLAFDRQLQFTCEDALAQSWSTGDSPSPAQYFAVIDVY